MYIFTPVKMYKLTLTLTTTKHPFLNRVCFYEKDNYYVFIPTEALKEKVVDSNL